ncbi:cell division protein FtsQ/DivIB [Sporosarcina contaminans]|uniref:Cell division protein DivIB n=1 Tax=Sporosarcina contaminans TaxID=633403 RepID=A0ABW3TX66_9BACL
MDKVIDIEDRIPSMREKRRRKTNKKFLFVLFIFGLALLLLLYFQSPLSKVKDIHIRGATLYDQQFYLEESGIGENSPFWGFDAQEVEEKLSAIAGVDEVKVTRKWMRDVEINISEWKMVAYIEDGDDFGLLLENGEMFPDSIQNPNVPILNKVDDEEVRKRITSQLLKMDAEVFQLISEIIYTGSEDDADTITAYMDDGYEVHAVIPTFAEKMAYYPEITSQLDEYEKGIIDMEVGTFFTPFSELYGKKEESDMDVEEDEQ